MIRYLWAAMVALAVVALAPSAMAGCLYLGGPPDTFQCEGSSGSAMVVGTSASDTFIIKSNTTGDIHLVSGGGADVLDFSDFAGPVTVDVTAVAATVVAPGLNMTFSGFGTGPGVVIRGGSGADILIGGAGDDVIVGGPGADTLNGNGGADRRGDTVPADCVGDTLNSIESDSCAVAPAAVPTLSEWAMILLGAALAGAAALTIQRRRTA